MHRMLISAVNSTKCSTIAALAFLLYDHAITFDSEVEFVWKKKWSFGKVLFVLNRYYGVFTLAFNITVLFSNAVTDKLYVYLYHALETMITLDRSCTVFSLQWEGVSQLISLLGAQSILISRIYAVYNRKKTLLVGMALLVTAECVSVLLINFTALSRASGIHYRGSTGCFSIDAQGFFSFIWAAPLVVETVLFLLMLYKAWRTYKDEWRSPLLTLLISDSVVYFLNIFIVLVVNFLIGILAPEVFSELTLGWMVSVSCALSSRLLLNMRQQYFTGRSSTDTQGGIEMRRTSRAVTPVTFTTSVVSSDVTRDQSAPPEDANPHPGQIC